MAHRKRAHGPAGFTPSTPSVAGRPFSAATSSGCAFSTARLVTVICNIIWRQCKVHINDLPRAPRWRRFTRGPSTATAAFAIIVEGPITTVLTTTCRKQFILSSPTSSTDNARQPLPQYHYRADR